MKEHFRRFAQYNAWANGRLYDACGMLPEPEYLAERGAFFGSIHGTLNHILVGDRAWMARLEGVASTITSLDEILHRDLASLRGAREQEDGRIIAYVDGLSAARLAEDLHYASVAGDRFVTPVGQVLAHLFNHQTHHRGQVHDLLSQTNVAPPPLDLMYYLREAG
ncbi:MAG: DinB family protein [Alphaproteobacteria bacterium]